LFEKIEKREDLSGVTPRLNDGDSLRAEARAIATENPLHNKQRPKVAA
jgi:hypothetical protein